MTVPRGLLILMMMVIVGISIVSIRGESAKAANRVQRLHQKQMQLGQTLWTQEMELARLRGPEQIRRRAKAMNLDLVAPAAEGQDADRGSKTSD